MSRIADVSMDQLEKLRSIIQPAPTVRLVADEFVANLQRTFESVALARLFLVLPYARLPPEEQATVAPDPRLEATTPILTLMATRGIEDAWNDRERSRGHRTIALLDRATVDAAPMVARLLADLDLDYAALARDMKIATRKLIGGQNGMFFVPDAREARDAGGRNIINDEFASKYKIASVFGMGGAYLDGVMAVAIVFTTERVDPMVANRFGSLISSFKIASMAAEQHHALFT